VLRRIVGPKGDELTAGWMKLHSDWLHNLDSSPSIIRLINLKKMSWAGCVARIANKKNACRMLAGKPEGKAPLGRPKCRLLDSTKVCLIELGKGMD
jgi:hypothetical protein